MTHVNAFRADVEDSLAKAGAALQEVRETVNRLNEKVDQDRVAVGEGVPVESRDAQLKALDQVEFAAKEQPAGPGSEGPDGTQPDVHPQIEQSTKDNAPAGDYDNLPK